MKRKSNRMIIVALAAAVAAGAVSPGAVAAPPIECTAGSGNCVVVLYWSPFPHWKLVCSPPCNMGD